MSRIGRVAIKNWHHIGAIVALNVVPNVELLLNTISHVEKIPINNDHEMLGELKIL